VASFAQVEAPAEDVADARGEGKTKPRQASGRPAAGGDGGEGGSNGLNVAARAGADGKREPGAGEDDGLLPGGPALFGERPADR